MRLNKLHKVIPVLVLFAMVVGMVMPIAAAAATTPAATNPYTAINYDALGNAQPGTPVAPVQQTNPGGDLECTSLTTCLAVTIYYIGPLLASKVAAIGAYFFSMMISLSLNSTAYALDFLAGGWTMVRDMANMAFIFILIYIAMTVMLEAETAGTIKTLAVVIIIALLVNFSFFFTRVVIDTGNILAVQFYNAIPTITTAPNGGLIDPTSGYKDLSLSIMGAGQIQTLLSASIFNKLSGGNTSVFSSNSWYALGGITVIYLSVAAFFWMLFVSFISVGIKFMMRIVGLWFILMSSPLAFVARTMHRTEGYFKKWLTLLIQFSLYPAIFMFMFLMLTRFASAIMTTDVSGSGGIFNGIANAVQGTNPDAAVTGAIASVGIRMGFLIALLYVSLRVADWVCAESSSIATKVSGVAGVGVSKAVQMGAGTSAWAARQTVGRGAYAASRSQLVNKWASRSAVGTALKGTLSTVGSAQLDVRNAPGASVLNKVSSAAVGTKIDAGKATSGKGGFAKQVADRQKVVASRAKAFKGDAIDVQKAQKVYAAQYDSEHGKGSYEKRMSELGAKVKEAKTMQAFNKRAAGQASSPEMAKQYLARAKEAEKDAKKAEAELKPMADVGADTVKERDKELIGAFAKRMGSRHWGNAWLPSFGSRLGAADANKLIGAKSAKDEMAEAAKKMVKEEAEHEGGGDHKEEHKEESKPDAAPKASAPKDDHGGGHH